MWGSFDKDRVFRSQFEPDGERFLFRYGKKAAPVLVTGPEMEECVATYLRRSRSVTRIGAAAIVITIVIFSLSGNNSLERDGATFLLVIIWSIPFMVAAWWAWRSPTEALRNRMAVGAARSRAQVRAQMLSEMRWPMTSMPIAIGALLVCFRLANWPPHTIESWIWFAIGLFFIATGTFNSIVKLRLKQT